LPLQRQPDTAAEQEIRAAIIELTSRAIAPGTVSADITVADVTALASGLRPDSCRRRGELKHLAAIP
jgi:hypothetical protein